jgi:hypothetical protein
VLWSERLCPFESDVDEVAEFCDVVDAPAFDVGVDEAPVGDELVADGCVFCDDADALDVAAVWACASNW